jgi:hypothetical protein
MTFPVLIHPIAGQFAAIVQRLDEGELVALEVRRRGLAGLFGKFRDNPTLRDTCAEAYKERDAELQE